MPGTKYGLKSMVEEFTGSRGKAYRYQYMDIELNCPIIYFSIYIDQYSYQISSEQSICFMDNI